MVIFFILLCPFTSPAQQSVIEQAERQLNERGEVYFKFVLTGRAGLENISTLVSIGKVSNDTMFAFANRKEFTEFLNLDLDYQVLTPPSLQYPAIMGGGLKGASDWDYYPTYDQYISMMQNFASSYPQICRLEKIGESVVGRDILFVKISDNVNVEETEPEFMYSSSMHGNELTGYVLLLRLIDYLLSGYGTDIQLTGIVNDAQIWINPLSNPDGAYAGGNSTVNGSTRYNANQVDLNRNYPDPKAGFHPDGNDWQPENLAMMTFMSEHHFVLSANLHTGSEVLNYPWDTWQQLHADNDWYYYICRQYADTVHNNLPPSLSGYLSSINNGITNGYAWYPLQGGRQDYVNYFLHGREITMELSYDYLPVEAMLTEYWMANYRSMINYIKQCTFGINGQVTDSVYSNPVNARIELLNHDSVHSEIYCVNQSGSYFRPVHEGAYDLLFSAPGYISKIINNVQVINEQTVTLNVLLVPEDYGIQTELSENNITVFPNPFTEKTVLYFTVLNSTDIHIRLFTGTGQLISSDCIRTMPGNNNISIDSSEMGEGIYFYTLTGESICRKGKLIKLDYHKTGSED